jgi:hypothetical protein
MIVIAGYPRSGTTIMFRCLVASGFNPGPSGLLVGGDHKSENKKFANLLRAVIHSEKMTVRARKGGYLRGRLIKKVSNYEGQEVLKHPMAADGIKHLYDHNERFRDAKYIWMRRDLIEIAKSYMRKQKAFGHKKPETFDEAFRVVKDLDKKWKKFLPLVDHIEVWLEDLLRETDSVGDRVSEFIGREFNTDLVTKNETYAETGRVFT